jgi:predicted ATPase
MSSAISPAVGLKALSIRDFRGIESLDLDFRRPDGRPNRLVVLAGPNGCGKTTVLEAALMSVGGHMLASGPKGRKGVRKGAEDFLIRATIVHESSLFLETDETETECTSHQELPSPDPKVPFWYFSSWRAPSLVGAVDVMVRKAGRPPRRNDVNRLKNVKTRLVTAAASQSFPSSRPSRSHDYDRWITRLNGAWALFHPMREEDLFVDLVEPDEAAGGSFDVFLRRAGGPSIPVDELSSGQLELFLFFSALVLNDESDGIVFIDEPELHLDPQWHATILRTLMELQPRAQFIVATHSPAIYETAKSYERHFLVPEDDPRAGIWGQAVARP